MRYLLRIAVVVAFSLPFARASARPDTLILPFRSLTIENGLSQGMVNAIIQDRYGFMWFATKDGLNRYDGYTFTVFRHDPDDSSTVRNNYVYALCEDRQGRLWVGTSAGLDLFDRTKETFHHIQLEHGGLVGMVQGIAQDAHGDLWVAHDDGVLKLTFTGETRASGDPRFTSRNFLSKTCFVTGDHAGTVWIGQLDLGGYRIRPDHSGNDQLDTLRLDTPMGDTRTGRSMLDLTGLTIVEDTVKGRIFGLHMFGIAEIDPRSLRVRTLVGLDSQLGQMRGPNAVMDEDGRIWIAVFTGIYIYDTATGSLDRALPEDPDLRQQAATTKCAFRDRSSLIWVGTTGYGILTHEARGSRFNTVRSKSVGPMQAVRDGRVMVSYYEGFLQEFDPKTRSWPISIPWSDKVTDPKLNVLSRSPRVMHQDERGTYWFNHAGILNYDLGRNAITRYPHDPAAAAAYPEDIHHEVLFLEGDSNIWTGTTNTFCRFDRRTGLYHHADFPVSGAGDTERFLHAVHRDANGVFWLGTSAGLLRYDRKGTGSAGPWKVLTHDPKDSTSLSSDIVYSILADPFEPEHVFWIGTNGGGFNRFDTRTGRFRRFTTKNGLSNDVVYGILSDEQGRLWMSTNKGISRFDPRSGSFRNYDASDGLQSDEFNRYSCCQLADGTLFFGGVKGFNYFHPKDIAEDSTPDPIRITGIRLINRPVDHRAEDAPLSAPAYLSEGMTIPHSTNMVTFEFATMEFSAPEERRYQYKLEGFDPDWILAGTDHSAVYTNLDPGSYIFRVRGDNRDGIWDQEGARFRLVVLPPWWRTWWFYALCVLAVGGGILLYIRLLTRQKKYLESTVAARTAELSAAKERAEQSERVKQQFLANMSHEIRTPMNAIMGMSNVLLRNEHLPAQKVHLDAIASSSENLLVIVNDILDLSKIEAGRMELEKVPMDPRAILLEVVGVLRYRAEEKGLRINTDIAEDIPPVVLGAPTRFHQVLMNLIGNGVKFTERGSVRVSLRVQERLTDAVMLRCEVKDTGIGIAPKRLQRVFDEFTQEDNDHTRKFGGTGLGLTICKRLVEMQGGTISATSVPGQGSTFTFTIPYPAVPSGSATTGLADGPVADEHLTAEPRDLYILLVEDNKLNVLVAEEELMDAIPGVRIDVAGNGKMALDMLAKHPYDLVLMDVQMPVMDGYEATRAIRAFGEGDDKRPGMREKSRIPIIAMTANVMKAEVDQCMEAGMDGFVPKPFKQAELLEAIRKVMAVPVAG